MSFREKSAWISFVSIFVAFSIYFARVARVFAGAVPNAGTFHLFLGLVVGLLTLEVVLHTVLAILSPREANAPKDERERLIDLGATRIAYPVLVAGALCAIVPLHLGMGAWVLAHAVLLAVVVAELVKFGAQIVYHRRGF